MKLSASAFFCAGILCLCTACPSSNTTPVLSLDIGDRAVRTDGIRPFTAHLTPDHSLGWNVRWRCDAGRIVGVGTDVVFLAPATTGPITVTVDATRGGVNLRKSSTLFVFRQFVVLKADDLHDEQSLLDPQGGWRRFIDLVERRGIRCGAGLITDALETPSPEFLDALTAIRDDGHVEIFHHGYDHLMSPSIIETEFQGSGYEHQLEHLRKGIDLAKEKLGIELQTFGAPFNRTDSDTIHAVDDTPEIKVWLFGNEPSRARVMPWHAAMEYSTGRPSFDFFTLHIPERVAYLVLQLHPAHYGDAEFAELEKIIDYLTERGSMFVQPIDIHRLLDLGIMPPVAETSASVN